MRYLRIVSIFFQRAFEIRSKMFVYFLLNLVPPLTMIIFWNGATHGGRSIDGIWDFPTLASYYLFLVLVAVFTQSHIEQDVAIRDIKEGGISPYILKPFSYFMLKLFYEVPYRFVQIGWGILTLSVLLIFYSDIISFSTSIQVILLTTVSLVLAYFLSFTLKMLVGIAAFWFTEIRGLFEILEVVILIFGGTLMPLSLLPGSLEQFSYMLPFAYTIYFPVIALQGQLSLIQIFQMLAVQLVWILAGVILYKRLWNLGVRKYSAIGQ